MSLSSRDHKASAFIPSRVSTRAILIPPPLGLTTGSVRHVFLSVMTSSASVPISMEGFSVMVRTFSVIKIPFFFEYRLMIV